MSCLEKSWFSGWRHNCAGTLYGDNKTSVTVDVLIAGFIFAAVCIALSVIVVVPGIRGRKRWFFLLRSMISVVIVANILICNFGQGWEVASANVVTPYRAGLATEIHANIGVNIGLRSVNITLRGIPEVMTFNNGTSHEMVNYNERFSWNNLGFDLGRTGFGVFAGRFNREFRTAQSQGTPYPILWIAEYFTIDGEGIRWGRHYLQAGYFTHILVWSAFPMWVITIILTNMVLLYAGIGALMTGLLLILSNVLYSTIRNMNDLSGAIPFDSEDGGVHIYFYYGWSFWLNLATGGLCLVVGLIIILLDCTKSRKLDIFFGLDWRLDVEEHWSLYDQALDDEMIGHVSSHGIADDDIISVFSSEEEVSSDDRSPGNRKKSAVGCNAFRAARKENRVSSLEHQPDGIPPHSTKLATSPRKPQSAWK